MFFLPPNFSYSYLSTAAAAASLRSSQAMRAILFNTSTSFAQNAGVMIGWICLSCGTVSLFTWWMRRREVAALLEDESIADEASIRRASREQIVQVAEEKKV